ncbi:MAG: membrane integrity-associated transporter subunit PqiC, partial [Planctomycetes bacterium]|nr:membrane integrity-associated transporter subunit PqiC [Planctomycetota bacterium]
TVLDGVSWSTHISDLIRDYVGHAIGSQAGVNMIAEGGLDIKAGCRLGVKVWSFELATGASAAEDTVEIALQFSLVRVKDSTLISRPTFTQSVPVPSAGLGGVVEGFKTAMSAAADEYGPWMRERMSQCKG